MSPYFLIPIAYLVGSVPVGLIIGKVFYDVDIREHGSHNIGASNFYRTIKEIHPSQAKPVGLISFLLDLLKGFVPVAAARHWFPGLPWIQILTGLAAIMGHNNSIFLRFKGGKGVATSSGVTFALSWKAAAVGFAAWGAVTFFSGFISLGSIISAPITGFLIWWLNNRSLPYGLFGLLVALSVVLKHKSNIKRLLAGTELSVRDSKLHSASESEGDGKTDAV
jgi:acyl phosphate:glycerol-3-phosphate acyltransferase